MPGVKCYILFIHWDEIYCTMPVQRIVNKTFKEKSGNGILKMQRNHTRYEYTSLGFIVFMHTAIIQVTSHTKIQGPTRHIKPE